MSIGHLPRWDILKVRLITLRYWSSGCTTRSEMKIARTELKKRVKIVWTGISRRREWNSSTVWRPSKRRSHWKTLILICWVLHKTVIRQATILSVLAFTLITIHIIMSLNLESCRIRITTRYRAIIHNIQLATHHWCNYRIAFTRMAQPYHWWTATWSKARVMTFRCWSMLPHRRRSCSSPKSRVHTSTRWRWQLR